MALRQSPVALGSQQSSCLGLLNAGITSIPLGLENKMSKGYLYNVLKGPKTLGIKLIHSYIKLWHC